MISQRLRQHVQDLHRLKADKIPALKRGRGHEVPLLRKKLFAIDNLLFSNGVLLCMLTMPRKATCPGVVGQHKTDSIFFVHFLFYFFVK